MPSSSQDQNERDKQLRFENELEKLKLSATRGAKFFSNEESNLPPEIEKKWLNYINEFENQFENSDRITVRSRLGDPVFPTVDELKEDKIPKKLDELYELMIEHNIGLDVLGDESEHEIYRFITEELFDEEIDDIQIEGMHTVFIYEEFHPNALIDIENELDNFFIHYLNVEWQKDLNMYFCDRVLTNNDKEIPRDDYLKEVYDFLETFDEMELKRLDIQHIEVNEKQNEADIVFFVHYSGWFEAVETEFMGQSKAHLRRDEYGFWIMYSLTMPPYKLF